MLPIGRAFLDATDGGLNIFRKYVASPFEVNEEVTLESVRFKIVWAERYSNYAVYIDEPLNGKWVNTARWNAIWFVKEKFGLTEDETYAKIDQEMNLEILALAKTKIERHQPLEHDNPFGLILK